MNAPDYDHPDLTAYVLGELDPAQSARVRQWLASSAEARAEYQQIQETIGALYAAPEIPQRTLHPRQLETVLAMAQAPAPLAAVPVATPLPVKPVHKKLIPLRPHAAPTAQRPGFLWQLGKVAAAAAVTAGAFYYGQKTAPAPTGSLAASTGSAPSQAQYLDSHSSAQHPLGPTPTTVDLTPAQSSMLRNFHAVMHNAPLPTLPLTKPSPAPITLATTLTDHSPAPTPSPAPAPASTAKPNQGQSQPGKPQASQGFIAAAQTADSTLVVHPNLIRPRPTEFGGITLAAPLREKPAASSNNNNSNSSRKAGAQPSLLVHSWKAEIASCPWDSQRRLMRLVVQMPVDQPAIKYNEADYRLIAKFDPDHVQSYRLVTEKHMQPSPGGTQATRFAWYEIIPTRNSTATNAKPITLGSLELQAPRSPSTPAGTLQNLKLVDRGQDWQDCREDYIFETSMVGFNLLLRGAEPTGTLNHQLILELAEMTKGDDQAGERAKFIQVIKQAQRSAGL